MTFLKGGAVVSVSIREMEGKLWKVVCVGEGQQRSVKAVEKRRPQPPWHVSKGLWGR